MTMLGRLVRWSASATVALVMTGGSLALVAWMNEDPSPPAHEPEHAAPKAVPLMAPPTPPAPRESAVSDAPLAEGASQTPMPSLAPPRPAPPRVSGLAPTAGPGTIALGAPGGSLPSMGTLPGSDLPSQGLVEKQLVPAKPKSRPRPRYPRLAQRKGIEGHVTLRLRIDATGRVEDVVVVEGEPPGVFDDAAMQTARRYRFTPARRGGEAVASTLQQTIRFELQQ